MKNYYFNTADGHEYKVSAANLPAALAELTNRLIADNNGSKVYPYYYSSNAKKIPSSLYNEYLSDLSF